MFRLGVIQKTHLRLHALASSFFWSLAWYKKPLCQLLEYKEGETPLTLTASI